MAMNVGREVAVLKRMTVRELREKYHEVFGEPTRAGNKDFLFKRIIWRMQAQAEGGLSERAKRRAAELARDADLRTTAPAKRKPRGGRPSGGSERSAQGERRADGPSAAAGGGAD